MSTSTIKHDLHVAIRDAEAFRSLFPAHTYEHWQFAGSVRRCREQVGDVEHVVVPRWGDVEVLDGLFPENKRVNLLMRRLDELVGSPAGITKHVYGGLNGDGVSRTDPPPGYVPTRFKWGDRSRGVDFRGFCHELYSADTDNLGSVFAIRTGPGGSSKMLVNALQRNGYVNQDGYVWNKNDMSCSACGWRGTFGGLFWSDPEFFPEGVQGKPKFVNGLNRGGLCPQCRQQDGLAMALVHQHPALPREVPETSPAHVAGDAPGADRVVRHTGL